MKNAPADTPDPRWPPTAAASPLRRRSCVRQGHEGSLLRASRLRSEASLELNSSMKPFAYNVEHEAACCMAVPSITWAAPPTPPLFSPRQPRCGRSAIPSATSLSSADPSSKLLLGRSYRWRNRRDDRSSAGLHLHSRGARASWRSSRDSMRTRGALEEIPIRWVFVRSPAHPTREVPPRGC